MHRSMCMAAMQTLTLLLLVSLAGLPGMSSAAAPAPPSGYRLELTHVDAKGGYTKAELLRRAEERTRRRATALSVAMHGGGAGSSPAGVTIRPRIRWSEYEYIMELAIGTPPVPFIAIADTGSDLIYTQSQPCKVCVPQPTPLYNPFRSRTFKLLPCSSDLCRGTPDFPLAHNCTRSSPPLCRYDSRYGDGADSKGVMGTETLTFGSVSVAGVAFGCSNENMGSLFNSTGLVGLGRGPQSLVAQLGFGKFAYCLTDYINAMVARSPLLLGSLADLPAGAAVQTTRLVQSPRSPSFYYISLEGISLGGARLPLSKDAFQLRADGSGGLLVDSGTTFLTLEEKAYAVVVKHVDEGVQAVGLLPANASAPGMTCYSVSGDVTDKQDPPEMVLHFAGGADMRLKWHNYLVLYRDPSMLCVAIDSNPRMSILGNIQQQNMHMLFDVTVGHLSFAPADCSKL